MNPAWLIVIGLIILGVVLFRDPKHDTVTDRRRQVHQHTRRAVDDYAAGNSMQSAVSGTPIHQRDHVAENLKLTAELYADEVKRSRGEDVPQDEGWML